MAAAVVYKVYGDKVQSMLVCKGQRPYISIAVAAHKVDIAVAILYVLLYCIHFHYTNTDLQCCESSERLSGKHHCNVKLCS